MDKLVIIGAGGFGREVAWLVERINKVRPTWELLGFVDDDEKLHECVIGGYPVLGHTGWLLEHKNEVFTVCAIGTSKIREKVIRKLSGVNFATLIDPDVIMSDRIKIGNGCIICAGSILTVDITLGSHIIINLDCTIGHDARQRSFTSKS